MFQIFHQIRYSIVRCFVPGASFDRGTESTRHSLAPRRRHHPPFEIVREQNMKTLEFGKAACMSPRKEFTGLGSLATGDSQGEISKLSSMICKKNLQF